MSWLSDQLLVQADRSSGRVASSLRKLAKYAATRRDPWEEELISRLCGVGAVFRISALSTVPGLDPVIFLAVVADESGAYQWVRNFNEGGTVDLSTMMINSIHKVSPERCTNLYEALEFAHRLALRRVRVDEHPLNDYRSFTSGRYRTKVKYAEEAWRRLNVRHQSWPVGKAAFEP